MGLYSLFELQGQRGMDLAEGETKEEFIRAGKYNGPMDEEDSSDLSPEKVDELIRLTSKLLKIFGDEDVRKILKDLRDIKSKVDETSDEPKDKEPVDEKKVEGR